MSIQIDEQALTLKSRQLMDALAKFKVVLQEESNILKKFNIESLPELLEQKSALSQNIEENFQAFNLCLGSQTPKTLDSWLQEEVFKTLSENLQKTFHQLIELTNECHDMNLANGMTVQTLSNINQASLNILTGQNPASSQIYGASGERQKSKNQTSLGKA
jgi:flagellar biosynthesis/type III secretory pathway chaperone